MNTNILCLHLVMKVVLLAPFFILVVNMLIVQPPDGHSDYLGSLWSPSLDVATKFHWSWSWNWLVLEFLASLVPMFVQWPSDVHTPSQLSNHDDQTPLRKLNPRTGSSPVAKSRKLTTIWVCRQRLLICRIAWLQPSCGVEDFSIRVDFLIHKD